MKKILIISISILLLAGCSFESGKKELQMTKENQPEQKQEAEEKGILVDSNNESVPVFENGYEVVIYGKIMQISSPSEKMKFEYFDINKGEKFKINGKDWFWGWYTKQTLQIDFIIRNQDAVFKITGIRGNDDCEYESGSCFENIEIKNVKKIDLLESETEVIGYILPDNLPTEVVGAKCYDESFQTPLSGAWKCYGDNSIIYDPCFVIPETNKLFCPRDPKENNGTVLRTVEKLPEEDNSGWALENTYSWKMELKDGASCYSVGGATFVIGSERANYECDDGRWLIGDAASGKYWTIKVITLLDGDGYLDERATPTEIVFIEKVWR